jgi:hypothetical protein
MTNSAYVKITLLVALIALSVGGFFAPCAYSFVRSEFLEHCSRYLVFTEHYCGAFAFFLQKDNLLWLCFKRNFGYYRHAVTMSHFAIVHWPSPATLKTIILNTTLADILIVWSKFFI